MLSRRTGRVSVSGPQQVTLETDRLQRDGVDVVDLGAGEPDFATPDHIKTAGLAAISDNFTKYTPNAGVQELREAICARYHADYAVSYDPADVIVTAGGKQALFNTAMALYGPEDEVITHAPGCGCPSASSVVAASNSVAPSGGAKTTSDEYRVSDALEDLDVVAVGVLDEDVLGRRGGLVPLGGLPEDPDRQAVQRLSPKGGHRTGDTARTRSIGLG